MKPTISNAEIVAALNEIQEQVEYYRSNRADRADIVDDLDSALSLGKLMYLSRILEEE